ncbi:MAG TPA: hypothetical protein DCZ88_05285 [Pseudanabaena sp.]|nr:hypothetical protein [Pseudanabaena sp.]
MPVALKLIGVLEPEVSFDAAYRVGSITSKEYIEIMARQAGMRDILAHQYDRINLKVLWDVIKNDIPELIEFIEPLIPRP